MKDTQFINVLVEGHIDPMVYQSVLETHAKECISFLNHGNISQNNIPNQLIERVQFTESEISPFRKQEYACRADASPSVKRQHSYRDFSSATLDFHMLENVLIKSYGQDETGRRPYPSAGGLYPVEPLVFIFPDRLKNCPIKQAGCYHFRPVSQRLQFIQSIESNEFVARFMNGFMTQENIPNAIVLYMAHVGKSIFKYRYRGYRHAAMEAGSMYQQATSVAQSYQLRTTLWSTFSEHQIMAHLNIDYGAFLPLTMQFFGFEK